MYNLYIFYIDHVISGKSPYPDITLNCMNDQACDEPIKKNLP